MQSLESVIQGLTTEKVTGAVHDLLAARISEVILTDFPGLIQLLYRLDISERKLKAATEGHTQEEIASIIAGLIIERQVQKAKSRQEYKNPGISEEERW
jgi:hypothetical protein